MVIIKTIFLTLKSLNPACLWRFSWGNRKGKKKKIKVKPSLTNVCPWQTKMPRERNRVRIGEIWAAIHLCAEDSDGERTVWLLFVSHGHLCGFTLCPEMCEVGCVGPFAGSVKRLWAPFPPLSHFLIEQKLMCRRQ